MRRVIGLALVGCLLVALPAWSEVLYGADGARANTSTNLYILDPATGAVLSTVGPIGFSVTGLAVHPATGVLYGSTSSQDPNANQLITINKTTGAGTLVGPFLITNSATLADLTFTSDGTLYGSSSLDANLYTVNLETGRATKVGAGDASLSAFGAGLAADSSGTVYLATEGDDGSFRTMNRTNGLSTELGLLDGGTSEPISAMAFNAAGTLYGSRLNNSNSGVPPPAHLVIIDKASLHVTEVGRTVDRLDAIVFDPAGTPPPPPPIPTVSLILNQKNILGGDPLQLSVRVSNPGDARAMDVFFGAFLPQEVGPSLGCPTGDALVLFVNGLSSFVTACLSALPSPLQPTIPNVVIPAALPPVTVPFFNIVWPADAPPGDYTFFMAFLDPGSFQLIAFDEATASFAP